VKINDTERHRIMTPDYEVKYKLRSSDFDCCSRLLPSAIMDFFQSAAGAHSAQLGCSSQDLIKKNLLWVVMRLKFEVLGQPEFYSEIISRTWPLPASRMGYTRQHVLEDMEGRTLVKGLTEWIVMDAETRKLTQVESMYPPEMKFRTDRVIEGRLKRLREFEPEGEAHIICPGYSALDLNGHVNNTKYADFVMDALKPGRDENIKSFQIDFHRELKCGSRVQVCSRRDGNIIRCKGINDEGFSAFMCNVELG
jgi:medium-chain acyl-[acyl-carrier-protein] hydrolase